MSDFSHWADRIVAQQMRERIAEKQRSGLVTGQRRSGRNALAKGLHSLADRLDN